MSFGAFRAELQSFKAQLHFELYRDLPGETILFQNRNTSAVTLYCWPKGKSPTEQTKPVGTRSAGTKQDFVLPLQTGFTGDISPGDKITYQGDVYTVRDYEWDAFNAAVTINAVVTQALSIQAA